MVSNNTPNLATNCDIGKPCVDVKQGLESVRLWVRLYIMPKSKVSYKGHQ